MKITSVNYVQSQQNQQRQREYNIPKNTNLVKQNNDIAFTGLLKSFFSTFDVWNPTVTPIQRLQNLAERAQNHSDPLANAIHRGDFKGKISKDEIIRILDEQRNKVKYNGQEQIYTWLIDHVDKTH